MRYTYFFLFSLFPIPDSRFPIPDSRFPVPCSLFPRKFILDKSCDFP
ncbi:MAG: hypothetical protein F6K50_09325 [Moorea sp. SIO3I7]|nr:MULTISPECIES: hypothetical protein [unclassified Moorena]NEN95722.1 hypothetical protein [Moorena sp. SIO3I7]NEO19109.1 hypothetical protein [Moorena sp. SIO4A5]NEP20771.1 hypothetical protein [Moorena sp. SIO3I6]NEQ57109.1 hypothetical protein [Moorena sp. SIO4A1]